jgi:hypothetical protein
MIEDPTIHRFKFAWALVPTMGMHVRDLKEIHAGTTLIMSKNI